MGTRDWRPFIYGGLASCTAEFGTFPIDTTKTRLQIQGQKLGSRYEEVRYRGMLHALLRISKEEGIQALYSGISPAVLRQATYGTIKFGVYYSLKKVLVKNPEDEDVMVNVCCGVLAGMVSSAIANPTDVLKVRMQAGKFIPAGGGAQAALLEERKGLYDSFLEIYRQEGVRGLWRGVGPTSQRAAVIAGVELPVYDATKRYFINVGVFGDTVPNHLVSSTVASLAGAVASTPIDVIRTRLMNQRKLKSAALATPNPTAAAIYNGSLDCLMQTIRNEGLRALYKGFVPTWVRMGPWNIIFFVTYEQLKQFH